MLWGLLAACLFGTSDIASSIATRTMHPLRLLLIVQIVGLAVTLLTIAAFDSGGAQYQPTIPLLVLTVAAAVLIACGSMVLFYGFAKSSVAIVSPISSTYPIATAFLAYFFGEQILYGTILGSVIVLSGIAALHFGTSNQSDSTGRSIGAGIVNGALAAVLWGAGFFLLARLAAQSDPLFAVFAIRSVSLAILVAVFAVRPQRWKQEFSQPAATLLIAAFSAAATTLGNIAFTVGSTYSGGVVLTSVIAAAYPAIPVIWSIAIGEKLIRPRTALGLGLVLLGIIVVVLSQPSAQT